MEAAVPTTAGNAVESTLPLQGTQPDTRPIRGPVTLPQSTYANLHQGHRFDYHNLCHDRYGYKAHPLEARYVRIIGEIEEIGDKLVDNRKVIVEVRRQGSKDKFLPIALSALSMDPKVRSLLSEDAADDLLTMSGRQDLAQAK